jgi:hypothetical protein
MADNKIPDDVRRFILSKIPSVPYLEAILLLRNRPEHPWTVAQVAERLYISEKIATEILTNLVSDGIFAAPPDAALCYQYAPSSSRMRETIDQLATTYTSHLVEVTNLIHSKSSKKAQQFADAFLWREDQ